MQAILDEMIKKTASLSTKERRELIQFLEDQERKTDQNSKKNPSPNIEWLKKHRAEYAGSYVALKDGELIAVGKTIKEADLKAKKNNVTNPLFHYIPAEDEEVWGGW